MEENRPKDVTLPETETGPAVPKKKPLRWLYWLVAVVALAVIALWGVKPAYLNYKSGQLVSQNYAPWEMDDDEGSGMSGSETMISELTELFANVGSGKDIKMTIYRLEKALNMADYDMEYYLYADDIEWYLALAYIQNNQFGSARVVLSSIMQDPDSDYADQAEALYRQIENMYFM